ncbi:unnamed protein product [Eruca vesicaria subsp. sativa]|uniref:Replication factor A C-terminal domain-containing protein n=1 Tax=Eruca vesicaria subsp. sativa TaxID=29727 RepID=A0ABC8J305_ERUVS|nr:unnamed protein product [Eruca vesicaria subsp. sativa]
MLDVSVTLSLFDAQAVAFHNRLEEMRVDRRMVAATSINTKMVGGRLFRNAISGTHIHFDKGTTAGEVYFYRLVARDTGLPPAAPLLRGYAKVEAITVSELNSFIITAPSQDIDFICTGHGGVTLRALTAAKKLERTVTSFTCRTCDNSHAVGSLRYRVEMSISDANGENVFVCFDGVMTKLHNLKASDAAEMLAADGVNPEETQLPPFIGDMEGKTYTFQGRVSAYNFTPNHKTFTITRIIDERDRVPNPDFSDNGGNNDDRNDNTDGRPVSVSMEIGGSIGKATPNAAATLTNVEPEQLGSSSLEVVEKARIALFWSLRISLCFSFSLYY